MNYAEKHTISIATDSGGDATVYSPAVTGRIHAIIWTQDTIAATADVTITLNTTGEAILTLTNQNGNATFYPRVPVDDEAGADATLDGTRKMRDCVIAAQDKVKVAVAQGGASKTGSIVLVVA